MIRCILTNSPISRPPWCERLVHSDSLKSDTTQAPLPIPLPTLIVYISLCTQGLLTNTAPLPGTATINEDKRIASLQRDIAELSSFVRSQVQDSSVTRHVRFCFELYSSIQVCQYCEAVYSFLTVYRQKRCKMFVRASTNKHLYCGRSAAVSHLKGLFDNDRAVFLLEVSDCMTINRSVSCLWQGYCLPEADAFGEFKDVVHALIEAAADKYSL